MFWLQKQNLKSASEKLNQCTKVKADYERIKEDLNICTEQSKEFKYQSIDGCSGENCLFQSPEAVEGYGYFEG